MAVVACPSSSGRHGIKKEKCILSGRAELSEGGDFTVLGEVELERADELLCSSYITLFTRSLQV